MNALSVVDVLIKNELVAWLPNLVSNRHESNHLTKHLSYK